MSTYLPLIPHFPFPAVESGRNPRINSPFPRCSATDCRSALSTRRNRSTQRRVDATLKTVEPSPHPTVTLRAVPRVCRESDGGDIRSRVNLWNKRREETDPECGRSTSRAAGVDVKKKKKEKDPKPRMSPSHAGEVERWCCYATNGSPRRSRARRTEHRASAQTGTRRETASANGMTCLQESPRRRDLADC